jgi:23S rRNA pseudouridine1911/1915/1917 synthase
MTRISARELSGTEGPFGRGIQVVRPEGVPEGSVVSVLRVPPEAEGMRLDRFVQSQLKRTSRTRAAAIVARGAYSPDAKRLRGNARVQREQCILLWREPWDEAAPEGEIQILYEDAHMLAVDKPAGVPVHPTARYHRRTVVKMLEAARSGERLFLSHRLDRETSGVLLLARTPEADRRIKAQFEERKGVLKQYLAIAWGHPPHAEFRVDRPLILDPASRYKVKMRPARPGEGLTAATAFTVLGQRTKPAAAGDEQPPAPRPYTLLRCTLETGRQHQIRVHLASIGLPIVGDKLYGPDDALFARGADGTLTDADRALLELDRHALHAERIELDHPLEARRLRIEAPLPADLHSYWDALVASSEPTAATSTRS